MFHTAMEVCLARSQGYGPSGAWAILSRITLLAARFFYVPQENEGMSEPWDVADPGKLNVDLLDETELYTVVQSCYVGWH